MKRLYVIGNGFDLYHDMPTSYECFNCFMCRKHPQDHERIGGLFDSKDANMLWCEFEDKLGKIDVLRLVSYNLDLLTKEEEYIVDNAFDKLFMDITNDFHDWVKQVKKIMTTCANTKRIKIDNKAFFLTFNYIPTLEKLYNIDEKQICYIHNDTGNKPDLKPIFGHGKSSCEVLKSIAGKSKKIKKMFSEINELPDWAETKDDFEERIVCKICKFLNDLKKRPADNIRNHEAFFDNCAGSKEIYVLGHSLAEVDLPYFEKIAGESRDAEWYASYNVKREEEDKKAIENMRKACGIDRIELITLDDLLKKE